MNKASIAEKVHEFKNKYQTGFEIIHETAEHEVLEMMKKHLKCSQIYVIKTEANLF